MSSFNYLSSRQFAELVGVRVSQIKRWDESGKLIPVERTPGEKRYYIKEQAGNALRLKQNMRKV
jgi:DNA-binding transcriptional MerR regulator